MSSFPDVWGGGNIFTFSGFEGKTDWFNPFVATLLKDRIGFTIRTEREKTFWLILRKKDRIGKVINSGKHRFERFSPYIVTGDIIALNFGIKNFEVNLLALPVSKNRFVIKLTPERLSTDAIVYLVFRAEACKRVFFDDGYFTIKTDQDAMFLASNQKIKNYYVVDSLEEVMRVVNNKAEGRAKEWDGDKEVRYLVISVVLQRAKSFDFSISTERFADKVRLNLRKIEKQHKDFFVKKTKGNRNNTLAKALSILKTNIESPQGIFKQRWSTPDRWPHRHLWLWDSCFHSLGYISIDKSLAEDSLLSVLDIQQKNGFIPHIGRPDGNFSNITQPPLLSWAVWKVYEHTLNKNFLKKCYPRLRKYLKWCLKSRDENNNKLLEWKRSDESGLDNSSRFNKGCRFDAVDFSSFLLNDLNYLFRVGEEIGIKDEIIKKTSSVISKKIEKYLWNHKKGFFFDRYLTGKFSHYKTACGFLPLFAGAASENQAERLIQHLVNKNEFNTPFPIPSEAVDSPTFDNNMWRGPVWLNYNYFLIEGLKKYGFFDIAEKIRRKTLKEVEKWYKKEGTIFEFYDPFARISPNKLPRKDRYGAIREFGWSAAIYIVLSEE